MKFRNKPRVVEADQWFPGKIVAGVTEYVHDPGDGSTVSSGFGSVITIHGESAKVVPGDWIITESDGIHHYPCKAAEFEKIYELID